MTDYERFLLTAYCRRLNEKGLVLSDIVDEGCAVGALAEYWEARTRIEMRPATALRRVSSVMASVSRRQLEVLWEEWVTGKAAPASAGG